MAAAPRASSSGSTASKRARALGPQAERFQGAQGLEGLAHAGPVVVRALGEVPAVQVPADHDDLLGLLAALELGDDVERRRGREVLRAQAQAHARAALNEF